MNHRPTRIDTPDAPGLHTNADAQLPCVMAFRARPPFSGLTFRILRPAWGLFELLLKLLEHGPNRGHLLLQLHHLLGLALEPVT